MALALHMRHHFTHAAATDGSKWGGEEAGEPGEARDENLRGAVAYGIWEGPKLGRGAASAASERRATVAVYVPPVGIRHGVCLRVCA